MFKHITTNRIKISKNFKEISYDGKSYRDKWKEKFASNLSEPHRNDIYLDDFLWHAISYRKIEAYEKSNAREMFSRDIQENWIVFFQNEESVYKITDSSGLSDKTFDKLEDVYIVNESFTKCYINTHEDFCGPYYIDNER